MGDWTLEAEQPGTGGGVLTLSGHDVRTVAGEGDIRPGMHVCALYSGPAERDRLLVPFVQEGLRHGDRCVCLLDDVEPAAIRRRAAEPPGAGDTCLRGHLGVYPACDVYPRAGELSVEPVIALLAADLASSTEAELPALRAAAELSSVLHGPGANEVLAYESGVDQILTELPASFLCLYDVQHFGVGTLVDALRIHSRVLLDGTVLHNPHCLAPADCPQPAQDVVQHFPLTRRRSDRWDGDDQWLCLTGAEVRVAELVSSGLTNRAIAGELRVSPHTVDAHLKHMYVKLDIHTRVELTVLALQHAPSSP